jgi:hypothetical protein
MPRPSRASWRAERARARGSAAAVRGGLTQSEIGARVGVSQMHVSRLIRPVDRQVRAEAEESVGVRPAPPPARRRWAPSEAPKHRAAAGGVSQGYAAARRHSQRPRRRAAHAPWPPQRRRRPARATRRT